MADAPLCCFDKILQQIHHFIIVNDFRANFSSDSTQGCKSFISVQKEEFFFFHCLVSFRAYLLRNEFLVVLYSHSCLNMLFQYNWSSFFREDLFIFRIGFEKEDFRGGDFRRISLFINKKTILDKGKGFKKQMPSTTNTSILNTNFWYNGLLWKCSFLNATIKDIRNIFFILMI